MPVREDNGIWHIPHERGEYVGSTLPAKFNFARTRKGKWHNW